MSTETQKVIAFEEVDGVGIMLKHIGTNFVLTITGSKKYYSIEFKGLSEHIILRMVYDTI